MSCLRTLHAKLFEPIDIASLVFLRIGFGLLMLVEMLRYLLAGWVKEYWIDPTFSFKYLGFGWVTVLPTTGMALFMLTMVLCSALIIFGKWVRISTAIFLLGWTYIFLLEQAKYLNHFYLIGLMTLILTVISPPRLNKGYAPFWHLFLIRAQLGIVYFYAGVAKLNADWLRGEPMRTWLSERSGFPLIGRFFNTEWVVYLFSYSGLLLDLLVVPFLLWKRTRGWAFALICTFHLLNMMLFNIGIFPWMMVLLTTIFFSPNWPRRWLRKPVYSDPPTFNPARLPVNFIAVYLVIQLLLPLRHFCYPGNVSWTEEGHNFSWHMKLRDKVARCEFLVRDPHTGAEWLDFPQERLTTWQYRKMSGRPDMILQYAYWLGDIMKAGGQENVEIYCTAMCSLNNRSPSLLTDPEVNLLEEKRDFQPRRWVTRHPR